eukprot:TRINITY_DN2919_c0_g1_i9.p1 TRINITY_DN2919_c0_g1~~TRINITY_DN2919_c0_g1_i9.p1  ORF type:complete len:198 (+),score=31.02 TRINITY_DN2919_c0_g1_i9:423-1016(+)
MIVKYFCATGSGSYRKYLKALCVKKFATEGENEEDGLQVWASFLTELNEMVYEVENNWTAIINAKSPDDRAKISVSVYRLKDQETTKKMFEKKVLDIELLTTIFKKTVTERRNQQEKEQKSTNSNASPKKKGRLIQKEPIVLISLDNNEEMESQFSELFDSIFNKLPKLVVLKKIAKSFNIPTSLARSKIIESFVKM